MVTVVVAENTTSTPRSLPPPSWGGIGPEKEGEDKLALGGQAPLE